MAASKQQPGRAHHAYAEEAVGLLIIAVLVLILAVVRYWHHIPWGIR